MKNFYKFFFFFHYQLNFFFVLLWKLPETNYGIEKKIQNGRRGGHLGGHLGSNSKAAIIVHFQNSTIIILRFLIDVLQQWIVSTYLQTVVCLVCLDYIKEFGQL